MGKKEFVKLVPKEFRNDARIFVKIGHDYTLILLILSLLCFAPFFIVNISYMFGFNILENISYYFYPPKTIFVNGRSHFFDQEASMCSVFLCILMFIFCVFGALFAQIYSHLDCSDDVWPVERVHEFLSNISLDAKTYIVNMLKSTDTPFSNDSIANVFCKLIEEEENRKIVTLEDQLKYGN